RPEVVSRCHSRARRVPRIQCFVRVPPPGRAFPSSPLQRERTTPFGLLHGRPFHFTSFLPGLATGAGIIPRRSGAALLSFLLLGRHLLRWPFVARTILSILETF